MSVFRAAWLLLIPLGASAAGGNEDAALELEGMSVYGNRELPKALVIVPWKDAELGEFLDRPVTGLVDEPPRPLDRSEFLRELRYLDTVHGSESRR